MNKHLSVHTINLGNGYKTSIVSPFIDYQLQGDGSILRHRIVSPVQAHARVPLFHRAFNLRCDGLKRVPFHFFALDGDEGMDDWVFGENTSFKDWIYFSEASILLRGASFTLEAKDEAGDSTGELQFLNPFTMNVVRVPHPEDRSRQVTAFWQQTPGGRFPKGKEQVWYQNELWYIKSYNPSDDIAPGISAGSVALQSAQLKGYLKTFGTNFFENGAMPVTILGLPEDTQPEEAEKVENWFAQRMQGLRNAWKVRTVVGEVKPTILTPKMTDLDMPGLQEDAVLDIASSFDVEKSLLLSDASNYATAMADYRKFAAYTLAGRADFYVERLNKILKPYGQRVEHGIQELPEMQEDETNRSSAFKNYVEAGMKPQLAARVLGIDIPEDMKKEFYDVVKPGATVEPTTISDPRAQNIQQAGTLPAVEKPNAQKSSETKRQIRQELKQWMRKAMQRFEEKKSVDVPFYTDVIPEAVKDVVERMLTAVKSSEDIRELFDDTIDRLMLVDLDELKSVRHPFPQRTNVTVNVPATKVDVHIPEQQHQTDVHVHIPEQKPADVKVDVHVPEQKSSPITVQVPEQKPSVVVVNVPEQKPADVIVNIDNKPKPMSVERDSQGRIKGVK